MCFQTVICASNQLTEKEGADVRRKSIFATGVNNETKMSRFPVTNVLSRLLLFSIWIFSPVSFNNFSTKRICVH